MNPEDLAHILQRKKEKLSSALVANFKEESPVLFGSI